MHNEDYVKSALGEALNIELGNSKRIRELRVKIQEMQAEIQNLRAENDELRRQLAQHEVV